MALKGRLALRNSGEADSYEPLDALKSFFQKVRISVAFEAYIPVAYFGFASMLSVTR